MWQRGIKSRGGSDGKAQAVCLATTSDAGLAAVHLRGIVSTNVAGVQILPILRQGNSKI
jgi:hypothetical protein